MHKQLTKTDGRSADRIETDQRTAGPIQSTMRSTPILQKQSTKTDGRSADPIETD